MPSMSRGERCSRRRCRRWRPPSRCRARARRRRSSAESCAPGAGDPGAADAVEARRVSRSPSGVLDVRRTRTRSAGSPLGGSATGGPGRRRRWSCGRPRRSCRRRGRRCRAAWNSMSRNDDAELGCTPARSVPPTRRKILPFAVVNQKLVAAAGTRSAVISSVVPRRDLGPDAPRSPVPAAAASARTVASDEHACCA